MTAVLASLIVALSIYAGAELMSAALDRLTNAVNAAVAKLNAPVPNDDDKLNELAAALETATAGSAGAPPEQGT